MAAIVYFICALTSLVCAGLLLRAFFKNRSKLLLWSCVCFAGIAINNVILFIDLMLGPDYDLSTLRAVILLMAMSTLLYGLVWDTV